MVFFAAFPPLGPGWGWNGACVSISMMPMADCIPNDTVFPQTTKETSMSKANPSRRTWALTLVALAGLASATARADDKWVVFEGKEGPGKGKHIVFVTGDEEYRSEESMPALAKILAVRHGFKCTVLFAIDKADGTINPGQLDNIPGLEALETADLMVMFLRFRELPDADMKRILDYTNSGKPIVALRTSTHPFFYQKHKDSPYAKYSWQNPDPDFKGGYGRQVLGETWVNHYGHHQVESTRGLIAPGVENHAIVRGVKDVWGPSDVYQLTTLHGDCQPVILGQVLKGMKPDDEPNPDKKLYPVAWTKSFTGTSGKPSRIFTTTMGHGDDLKNEGLRRLLVNACFWGLGMEDQIPAAANVDFVTPYDPVPIGYLKHKKGIKPADHKL